MKRDLLTIIFDELASSARRGRKRRKKRRITGDLFDFHPN